MNKLSEMTGLDKENRLWHSLCKQCKKEDGTEEWRIIRSNVGLNKRRVCYNVDIQVTQCEFSYVTK